MLSTSKSSKPERTCLRKLRRSVTNFAPSCRSVKVIVHGPKSSMELVCISFPITWVLKYVPPSSAGKLSDPSIFLWPFQWFQLIIANRPRYDEDVTTLNDINDIRNGVFASATIHQVFDSRHIAILKVCHIFLPVCPLSDILRLQTTSLVLKTSPATNERICGKI